MRMSARVSLSAELCRYDGPAVTLSARSECRMRELGLARDGGASGVGLETA
jgi:hypothetical protein